MKIIAQTLASAAIETNQFDAMDRADTVRKLVAI